MRRISVVGNSGSGKTTLAQRIAHQLDIPHLELDSIFHLPGWRELPTAEFRHRVAEYSTGEAWVIDGNYSAVQDLVWRRADTIVWLDLPRHLVMRQLVPRTLRRLVRRTELWNGNREPWTNAWSVDPQRSIVAWAWTQHRAYRRRYGDAMTDPARASTTFVVLRSRREIETFVAALDRQSTTAW